MLLFFESFIPYLPAIVILGVYLTTLIYFIHKNSLQRHKIAFQEHLVKERDSQIHHFQQQVETYIQERQLYQYNQKQLEEQCLRLELTLEQERHRSEEQQKRLENQEQQLKDSFKILSQEVLQQNNQAFLELASARLEKFQETASGELLRRQQSIDSLLKPMKESLEKVDNKMQEIERLRTGVYSSLSEQIRHLNSSHTHLQQETSKLVKALRMPHIRGRWGEIQLQRVAELAGMLEHCDFVTQEQSLDEERRLRPDMIVKLPNNRQVIVDAKTPLQGYLDSLDALDEPARKEKLREHAKQVRQQLVQLSSKSYWGQFQSSPEFVILFLPGEPFLSAALEEDPELIEYGVHQQVLLATPTTLIGLLKAISYGWRQEQIAKHAQQISSLGHQLYERLKVMSEHFIDMRRSLEKTMDSYNKTVGSFEGRVLVTARKFKDLGVTQEEEIPQMQMVHSALRLTNNE